MVPGTEFAKKVWGGQNLLFAKVAKLGAHYGIDTWLRPSWWYSN